MQATGAIQDVTVIGYSMGGGEAARYMSRHDGKGVIKVGLYASVTPGVLQSEDNPHGNPASGFDDIKAGIEKDIAGTRSCRRSTERPSCLMWVLATPPATTCSKPP